MSRSLLPLGCAVIASAAVAGAQVQTGPAPSTIRPTTSLFAGAPMARIASGDLSMTVALPDAAHGFYRSTRFDWSGMVTEARLGRTRFYGPWFDGVSPEVHDFSDTSAGVVVGAPNAGTGPAEEFANRDGETVPGYNAAPVGGSFIKIGVGRLRKPDAQPYDHFRVYPIVDGGKWTVQRRADRIVFRQLLLPDASGYGFDYEKTLTLTPDGGLILAHRLTNLGSRPIKTQVYTHNFARFDGADVGAGMRVDFPSTISGPVSAPSLATVDGSALRYLRALSPGDRVQLPPQPGGIAVPSGPFRVVSAGGAAITMQGDTPLVRTAFWSIRRAVAVEPFVPIDVAPGATQRWTWRYRFIPDR